MKILQKYIKRRDSEMLPESAPPVAASSSASAEEPSDEDLLAAAAHIDVPAVVIQPSSRPEPLPSAARAAAPEKQPLPTEELLLPEGWKHTLPKEQHLWVSKALFTKDKSGRLVLTKNLRLWWHPPGLRPLYSQPPSSPDAFYHARLFLWIPYRLWAYRLLCSQPNCHRLGFPLTACGMYKTLDVSGWYFMATEYLECRSCKKKLAAWSQDILNHLDPVHSEMFPAVLTYRLSCYEKIVRWMRGCSLGNSATSAYRNLCVRHREHWIAQTTHYLSVVGKFLDYATDPSRLAAQLPQMSSMAAVSLCQRCIDTASGTKGQCGLYLWNHPEDGFHKKGH